MQITVTDDEGYVQTDFYFIQTEYWGDGSQTPTVHTWGTYPNLAAAKRAYKRHLRNLDHNEHWDWVRLINNGRLYVRYGKFIGLL